MLLTTTEIAVLRDYCLQHYLDWRTFDRNNADEPFNRGRRSCDVALTEHAATVFSVCNRLRTHVGGDDIIVPIPAGELPHMFTVLFDDNTVARGVQRHTDKRNDNNWLHFRINAVLQHAISGGEPIIDSVVVNVNEGEAWSIWASESLHSALPVKGDKPRIALSLGYYVNPTFKDHVEKQIIDVVDYIR